MKNAIKLLSMMLIAGTIMASCNKPEGTDPVTPTPTTYTVQVNSNDATLGTATITPLKAKYNEGDTVTITATPADGAKFLNWNGSITDNPYVYVVKENMVFTANFEALPQAGYTVTFNGTALDVAGFSQAATNGQQWLFQCAKSAEGTRVSLPYLVLWMEGSAANALTVTAQTELYYQTAYTAGQNQYGDYQFKSLDNMNCTQLDLTTNTMSMTASCTMYDLGPIARQEVESAADCPTATMAVTLNNITFEPVSKGGLTKLRVK
jgi:hypothetical protein